MQVGSIPGQGAKISHAMGNKAQAAQLLRPHTLEPTSHNSWAHVLQQRSHVLQLRPDAAKQIHIFKKK